MGGPPGGQSARPFCPQKRTFVGALRMSALCHKRTYRGQRPPQSLKDQAPVMVTPRFTAGRQIFTRFRLNRSAGRACATDAQAITTEVGGHVESLCCRSCCFRSFCGVLQPTQYLACALFDVDVDGTSCRLPLSLDGSRSQPTPDDVCLGRK